MKKFFYSLSILLCLLGVSENAWATNYFKIRVKAVYTGGASGAHMYAGLWSGWQSSFPAEADRPLDEFTTGVLSSSSNPDVELVTSAIEGVDFLGWYKDEACTILASGSLEYNAYGSSGIAVSTDEASAPTTTFYAKYAKSSVVWSDYAEAPVAGGKYYLYSAGFNALAGLYTYSDGKVVRGYKDANQAVLFTISDATNPQISCVDEGVTKYVNKNGTYIETTAPAAKTLVLKSDGSYMINLNNGHSSGYTWWEMQNSTYSPGSCTNSKSNESSATERWRFIPEAAYNALCTVESLVEDPSSILIDATPTASGSTTVKFNVSEVGPVDKYEYTIEGGDGNFVLGTPTRDDQVITVPVTYTAQNVHSGTSKPISAATVRMTAKNPAASTATGLVPAYVNLSPQFALNVDELDWSYDTDGETLVETYYAGMEVAASQRERLQNKLIFNPAQTTGVAANFATWTATIVGDDAAQFKFANGTRTVSGPYTPDLLDVIFAPNATGEFSATLHVETSYKDANNTELKCTQNIALRGKAEAVSVITFEANADQSPSDDEHYSYGEIIGTNSKDVSVDLFMVGITGATKVWSDPDDVFEFDESTIDFSKTNQMLTFRAHRTTPVTSATNHTATLTISGIGSEGTVTGVLTLAYQALPLLTPEVTWNWSTVEEGTVATNPLSTTSDGAWTLTKLTGDKVTYNDEAKSVTTAYVHHEPATATFALSISQTDTYAAYNKSYELLIGTQQLLINTKAKYEEYVDGGWSGTFDEATGELYYGWYTNMYFFCQGQTKMTFTYRNYSTEANWTVKEYFSDNTTNIIYTGTFNVGANELTFSPNTVKLEFYAYEKAYFSDVRLFDYTDTITADYDKVVLINDNGTIHDLAVTATFSNTYSATVALNAAAQPYFELQTAGKASGASIVFDNNDLGLGQVKDKVITITLKEGADAAAAAAATAGNACQVTFGDNYTYNHHEFSLPVILMDAYDVVYKKNDHGTYTVTYEDDTEHPQTVSSADFVKHLTSIAPEHTTVTISAPVAAEGYAFQGWKINDVVVSCKNSITKQLNEAATIEAVFAVTDGTFKIDDALFSELSEALGIAGAIADQNPVVVLMKDLALTEPATYTIPAGVTLLIPHKANFYDLQIGPDDIATNSAALEAAAKQISIYRMLTLKDGVNIICNGNICVAGHAASANGGRQSGYVAKACGVINMANGGHIELNDGANLYCWGFVKGQDMDQGNNTQNIGTITANEGATAWEDFEMGDWRGGTASTNIAFEEGRMLFPFQSYSLQNIEVPITYKYGSKLMGHATLMALSSVLALNVAIIGSDVNLFLLKDEQSIVRKWYDPTTDLVCFELSGSAQLDALVISFGIYEFNSAEYNLPLSNSMHIILSDCNMTLAKPLTVQAGAVLEVKESATVNLEAPVHLYDLDEWGNYIYNNCTFRTFNTISAHKDRGAESLKDGLDDAKLIIDGTLNVVKNKGYIYATSGGANIMGNGGGKIIFGGALPSTGTLWHVTGLDTWGSSDEAAANLCNDDASYTQSSGFTTYYNVNGRWFYEDEKDEQPDHTYNFYYLDQGNTGEEEWTAAVYSHDKTGLIAGMKWFNVVGDENCADWWTDTLSGHHYNYTYLNAWHQFMATETPSVYSGSNNKLYAQDECSWSEMGSVDENCLYTFVENEQEVKKALVNGHFIPLESNGYDPAYHAVANAEQYYICFAGCNWHEATPYEGEYKAYTIAEGGDYIWFNNDWLNVERDALYFYTADEITNVKTYYEYLNGEWIVATPYVSVADGVEEPRTFFSFQQALKVASTMNNATITILRDFTEDTHSSRTPMEFTKHNTNCTLDLNGHIAEINVEGSSATAVHMLTLNGEGSTFTITDNSPYKLGELHMNANVTSGAKATRWYGIYVQQGELIMNAGKVYAENMFTYTSTSNTGVVSAITVAGGKQFTLNGGDIEAKAPYSTYGVHLEGSTITTGKTYIKGGTITASTTVSSSPIGLYIGSGTAYVSGGTINANTKTTTARGIYVEGSTSNYIGHLEMTGGTVNATATTTTAYGIYVGGGYTFNNTKPNTIKATFRGEANISGGTVNAVTNGTTTAYGVVTLGTTTITGGAFNVTPKSTTASGVLAQDGTVTISDDAVFTVKGTDKVYGVYANGATPADKTGRPYKPVVTINGGTFNVTIPSGAKNPYGINVDKNTRAIKSTASGYYAGNYASEGTVIVNDGVFNVTSPGGTAYDVVVAAAATQSGATGYDAVTATPRCTINGGKFVATGNTAAKSYPVNGSAAAVQLVVNAGYFSNNLNLATYAATPNQVITLTSKDANYPTYKYKVAEAYTVTFMNGETVLQTGLQEINEPTVYAAAEPTKANTETNSYIFDGWATEAEGEVVYAKGTALPDVTADATYYAHFNETTKKWRVTWNANGGVCDIEYSYVANNKKISTVLSALPAATRTGYTLAGWYTKASGGSAISTATKITADKTYYAHWTANKHILTWDLSGGIVTTAGTAAELDATGTPSGEVAFNTAITKPVVARAGYTFVSWDATPVAKMPDDDLTYTAQWKANTNTPYQVLHKKQNPANLEEYITVDEDTEDKTGTTATYVTPATKTYVGYVTPAAQTVQIAGEGNLVVEYLYDLIGYTITFDANGGTCGTASADVKHGATLTLPEATREGVGNISYEFAGWFTKAVGGDQITASTIIQRNIGTLYAHWTEIEEAMPDIIAEDGQTITIDDDYIAAQGTNEVTNIIIEDGGKVTVTANIEVDNLYLEGADGTSGQLIATAGKVTATNAFYDYAFNETVRHWRAFGVPWMVNLDAVPVKEVKNQAGDAVSRTLVLGRDYDIIYYNGAKRAAEGPGSSCWEWVKEGSHMLQPGKCYMIAFNSNVGTLRFAKAYGAPVVFNGTMNVAANTADDPANAGINAIANPMTYHTTMNAGPTTAQVHNGGLIGEDDYIVYNIEDKKFVVGKAVYVQVRAAQSVVIDNAGSKGVITPAAAPKRNAQRVTDKRYLSLDDYYTVAIQGANETSAAKVYVLPEEDKADEYVIGHDLAKMGMSASRSQIWVKEYGVNLCMHTAAPFDGVTEIPVKLYAPVAGEYSITNVQSPITNEDYTVYLTRDGEVIWNLSNSPYSMTLSSGTNSNYGLRISAKVPQVTTGIDEAIIDAQGETRKVLINDKVYIIRGDKAYSIDGQTAK